MLLCCIEETHHVTYINSEQPSSSEDYCIQYIMMIICLQFITKSSKTIQNFKKTHLKSIFSLNFNSSKKKKGVYSIWY
jgi:hypothetical protein